MGLYFLMLSVLVDGASDWMMFLGRIHPLIVHFPIAFLLLAALAEFCVKNPKFEALKSYTKYLWGLGIVSTLLAIILGYLLSLTGDYNEDTVFWHKWIGVAVLLVSLIAYQIAKKQLKLPFYGKPVLLILIVIMVFYSGHLGGNLTHGSSYLLEYAPNVIRQVAGLPKKAIPRKNITLIDSADVYLDLISPMLQNRCASCHNNDKKKGDLDLTSYAELIKGGENGEVIKLGSAESSDLFRRITLPDSHDDFMPTDGKRPLTTQEVNLIEWWINAQAPSGGYFMQLNPDKRVTNIAESYLGLDYDPFDREIKAPSLALLDSLRAQGFIMNQLIKNRNFFEANFSLSEKPITSKSLESLVELKEQLIWLNMYNANLKDDALKIISQLENLIKLNLSKNPITDVGLQQLTNLQNLTSLNLYNTKVSNDLLAIIPTFKRLKRLYISATQVAPEIVEQLQKENPQLIIVFD